MKKLFLRDIPWCDHDGVLNDMILLFFPVLFQMYISINMVRGFLYRNMDIGTMWHWALVSCTPSHVYRTVLGGVLFWCCVSLCAPSTISLLEFYFIMIFIMIVVTIIEIFMAILFILNYTFWLSVTKYFWFCKRATPCGWFRPWTVSSWWRHQMETFSALLALRAGNSPVSVNSPHKGQWRGALMFSLICARINDWVNNREAGDLRRHRGHCAVIVMLNIWLNILPLDSLVPGLHSLLGYSTG